MAKLLEEFGLKIMLKTAVDSLADLIRRRGFTSESTMVLEVLRGLHVGYCRRYGDKRMIHFKQRLKLPGPKALGMSDNDYAMPSRLFPNNPTETTWEDYEEKLAQLYPVRFFLAYTLTTFFQDLWRDVTRPFKNAYWYVRHHTIDCYHWLDLRQPKGRWGGWGYNYGYCEVGQQIEYAIVNIFVRFVEDALTYSYFVPSEEEAAKDNDQDLDHQYTGFKRQLDDYKEMMAIYQWITKERCAEQQEHDDKLTQWSDARQVFAANERVLWEELQALEERNDAKLEEMLARILKIRNRMWT